MTMKDLLKAWNAFRTYAARDYDDAIKAYACAVEVQERGALHCHVLYTSGSGYLDNRPERDPDTGAVLDDSPLAKLCQRVGFGNAWVEEVKPTSAAHDLARYTGKEMGSYLSKDKLLAVEAKIGKNRRPLRLSQKHPWSTRFPTLGAAREELKKRWREEREANGEEWIEDKGPWVMGVPAAEGFKFPSLEKAEDEAVRHKVKAMQRRAKAQSEAKFAA